MCSFFKNHKVQLHIVGVFISLIAFNAGEITRLECILILIYVELIYLKNV